MGVLKGGEVLVQRQGGEDESGSAEVLQMEIGENDSEDRDDREQNGEDQALLVHDSAEAANPEISDNEEQDSERQTTTARTSFAQILSRYLRRSVTDDPDSTEDTELELP